MHTFTMTALISLVAYALFSIFLANVAHQLDISLPSHDKHNISEGLKKIHNSSIINNSYGKLMWFIQISDLHLSKFQDQGRIEDLNDFSCNTIHVINPAVIIASGDLTDAKNKDNMGSSQQIEEWVSYRDTVQKCIASKQHIWLDIRGNHDNFNVPGWRSNLNYFREYSIQGKENPRSYVSIVEKHGEKYAFLGVDACLNPGPKRPFNFIGMLTNEHIDEIKALLDHVKRANVSHTIWFSHYPTSCILTVGSDSFRKVIGDEKTSMAYLCGHLHQMGGMIKDMYTMQRQGFLELELGDWKDNRMFRLAAIDHGLFSFVDIKHGHWPIILVTNPKNALLSIPQREHLSMMNSSTHIRIITFSIAPIESVEVNLSDGKWLKCSHVDGPLYVANWNPSAIGDGIHTLFVRVKDVKGRTNTIEHQFSLDGTKLNFNILSKVVLMVDALKIFQFLFGTMLMVSILPLVIMKIVHLNVSSGRWKMMVFKRNIASSIIRKFWLLASVDRIFYPLIFYEIYLCFGPWCVGEIIEGYIGVVFPWGILVNGVFIPGSFTYMYGFFQFFVCQFPMTLVLANTLDKRFQIQWCRRLESPSLIKRVTFHIPFIFILSMNMVFAYFFKLAYGTCAFVLGPLRTWSVLLNFYLWYKTVTLPANATWEVSKLWATPTETSRRNENFVSFLS